MAWMRKEVTFGEIALSHSRDSGFKEDLEAIKEGGDSFLLRLVRGIIVSQVHWSGSCYWVWVWKSRSICREGFWSRCS